MKPKTLLLCVLGSLLTVPLYAQTVSRAVQNPARQFAFYHNTDQSLTHLNFFEKMGAQMQIAAGDMVLETQNTDKQGFTHYKYQQYYQHLPVFGCHYFLHEKDGFVRSANGQFQSGAATSIQATLSARSAESFALRAMHARRYDKDKSKAALCFFNPSSGLSARSLRLAYMVDLHSIEPYDKRRYFIDANTGKILREYPLMVMEGVPSKASTYYYGIQEIISDSLSPQEFVLRDLTRGEGIFVYDYYSSKPFTNNSSFWDLGNGVIEEIGLDAHYCTEQYYDMMSADYHWEGVDGLGGALVAFVHGGPITNAFWDGERSIYGDGDCHYGPLTTLEIVGHEFTHGMVDYTSNLAYYSESGAINESLADIFGKLLERKVDPAHFSWNQGHSIILDPASPPFRVMDDPNSIGLPAYYKGLYWSDFSDVHDNSSIGNLWFSMIVDGKQGANEVGYHFNIAAIGPDKAGQIVFNANRNYLGENATYNDFCAASIEVAGNLYGQGSPEQMAVSEAWKAVGLPYTPQSDTYDLLLSITDPNLLNLCGLGQFVPLTFTIVNNGTVAYDPATQGKITLSNSNLPDRVVSLNNPIAPGESVDITVSDWLKTSNYGYLSAGIKLNVADDNPSNNAITVAYSVVQYESGDIVLSGYFETGAKCLGQIETAYFYVTNNSCQPIPAGTEWMITGQNLQGNTVWSSPLEILATEVSGGFMQVFTYKIPHFAEEIIYTLHYPSDPDPGNNQMHVTSLGGSPPITGNYLNTFELSNGNDGFVELNHFGNTSTVLYQNSHFFVATGTESDPDAFEHCKDPFHVFNSPHLSGINATVNACLDFSTAVAPILEFDAALFLNFYSAGNSYPYSSMLQAKWDGAESGNQIIYNQPEGQITHTKINLPPYFKGALNILLYTELGHLDANAANLSQDDFVLLDNLQLSAATSGSFEAPKNKAVQIAPNPAQETVSIQTGIPVSSISIFNASGQSIRTFSAEGLRQNLDIKNLTTGLYWIRIRFENGSESAQKLVKID